jgi:hypothetical protein
MPLKLNVGVSKKVGLPGYGSVGASCNVEVERPEGLVDSDLEAFHERGHDAHVACHQAVFDELSRLAGTAATMAPNTGAPAADGRAGDRTTDGAPDDRPRGGRPHKPTTPGQVRAIVAIAQAQHADLTGLLRDEFGVDRPENLSVAQSSRVIDALKAASGV